MNENGYDRFELEGFAYYRQGRRCGRPGCKCAAGELHGPYFYRRDLVSGKVAYVGKQLPEAVSAAREYHNAMLGMMLGERRRLAEQLDALSRLIGNRCLSESDRATLTALGFGAALVSEPGQSSTQD